MATPQNHRFQFQCLHRPILDDFEVLAYFVWGQVHMIQMSLPTVVLRCISPGLRCLAGQLADAAEAAAGFIEDGWEVSDFLEVYSYEHHL